MSMDRFEIIIFWSDEDQAFIADVPELPGCMAHGDTHELALAQVRQAMRLWLDTAQSDGRTVPQARGGRLMFA
jgi:predicted RNase H-like HicB family nuclease